MPIGKRGEKKIAVIIRLAVFANIFAMSTLGPSKSLSTLF
jgi:hypothetical protein